MLFKLGKPGIGGGETSLRDDEKVAMRSPAASEGV